MNASSVAAVVGRFAPSPTGRMHAGNIFSALLCWLIVRLQGGRIVLRIEDLDQGRSRREHAEQIMVDLEALGLTWDEGPYFQSDRSERYREALAELERLVLLYPCFCTRADLRAASAPHDGEQTVYSGACRDLTVEERARHLLERKEAFTDDAAAEAYEPALRVRCDARTIEIEDLFQGLSHRRLDTECGDFVVRRTDGGASYQLAVVVDDAEQGVNCIVRGCDLLPSAFQQAYLQQLLDYRTPAYAHVPLFVDETGVRLAKRHRSASMEELLAVYGTPERVLGHICRLVGLSEEDSPMTPEDLLRRWNLEDLQRLYRGKERIVYQSTYGTAPA